MLVLPERIVHADATACCRMLAQGLRALPQQAVVDGSALREFDSAALAVLLDCRREALALGKTLSVRGMPPRLRQLATLYGVAELLPDAP